jgi:hypothetical protein
MQVNNDNVLSVCERCLHTANCYFESLTECTLKYYLVFTVHIKNLRKIAVWCSGDICDFYLEGAQVESLPEYLRSMFVVFLSPAK